MKGETILKYRKKNTNSHRSKEPTARDHFLSLLFTSQRSVTLFCFLFSQPCYSSFSQKLKNNNNKKNLWIDLYLYPFHFPGAIAKNIKDLCAQCTDVQHSNSVVYLQHLQDHHPADYDAFLKKYDPENHIQQFLVKILPNLKPSLKSPDNKILLF